jgi:hypothetical protein
MRRRILLLFTAALLLGVPRSARTEGSPEILELKLVPVDAGLLLSDERSFNLLHRLKAENEFAIAGGTVRIAYFDGRAEVEWPGRSTPRKVKIRPGGSPLTLTGLQSHGKDLRLLFLSHPRFGTSFVLNGLALTGKVPGCRVTLLDCNLNGRYGERRKDGVALEESGKLWVTPSMRVMPLPGEWGGFTVDQEAATLKLRKESRGSKREYREAVTILNEARLLVGVRSSSWDPELSDGCELHCAYMNRNGLGANPHAQEKGKAGYTAAGHKAARNSCIGTDGSQPAAEFAHDCLAMFYHRLPLIQPGTWLVGVMRSNGYNMLDGVSGRRREDFPPPLVYPVSGQFDVPRQFKDSERPSPIPDGRTSAGFPITLDFGWGAGPTDVKAKLTRGDDETEVPIAVTWPAKPASEVRPNNDNSILILPLSPLGKNERHHAWVSWERSGARHELDWEFFTGEEAFGATWREE